MGAVHLTFRSKTALPAPSKPKTFALATLSITVFLALILLIFSRKNHKPHRDKSISRNVNNTDGKTANQKKTDNSQGREDLLFFYLLKKIKNSKEPKKINSASLSSAATHFIKKINYLIDCILHKNSVSVGNVDRRKKRIASVINEC